MDLSIIETILFIFFIMIFFSAIGSQHSSCRIKNIDDPGPRPDKPKGQRPTINK